MTSLWSDVFVVELQYAWHNTSAPMDITLRGAPHCMMLKWRRTKMECHDRAEPNHDNASTNRADIEETHRSVNSVYPSMRVQGPSADMIIAKSSNRSTHKSFWCSQIRFASLEISRSHAWAPHLNINVSCGLFVLHACQVNRSIAILIRRRELHQQHNLPIHRTCRFSVVSRICFIRQCFRDSLSLQVPGCDYGTQHRLWHRRHTCRDYNVCLNMVIKYAAVSDHLY